jgi:Na+/melibiose symporter-like transporter
MIITVLSVKERKEFQKPLQKFHWRQAFVEPFTVRTFVYALLMYLLTFVAMDAVSSIVVYYMKYYLGRGDEANYVTGVLLVAQVISLPFYILLSRRTSKRRAFIVGALIWAGAMLFSLALTPASPAYLVYAFATLVGFGTGGIVVMMYAIFPDIPDVDELVTGERREGTYSALITFVRKLSAALAIFAVSNAIGWAGYQAPLEESVAGVTTLVEQPQSELFVLVLRLIFFAIPIVLLTLAVIVARRYPLSPQVHQRLNALLAHRRAGGEQTAAEQAEAAALIHELVR